MGNRSGTVSRQYRCCQNKCQGQGLYLRTLIYLKRVLYPYMLTSDIKPKGEVSCVRIRKNAAVLWLTCLLLALASQAKADLMSFSVRTNWENASSSLPNITFAGLGGAAGDAQFPDSYSDGLTLDGVTFMGSVWGGDHYLFVRSSSPNFLYGPPDGSLGCPISELGNNPPCPPNAGITVTLPSDVTSGGWDFGNFYLGRGYRSFC